jgi:predicted PurR-regulated permease PerM
VQPDPPGDLAPASPIRLDTADVAGARRRLRLDWRTFVYLVAAMLAAFALIAVARGTSTMLTRIGVGLLIALALDPLTDSIQRRFGTRRSVAVAAVAALVFGLATLIGVVLGPRAVDQAQQFSDELPETLAELERLPLIGDRLAEADVAARIEQWIERLPEHVTDARVAETAGSVISGLASVAIVAILAIAVLADGEQLVARFRRLLPPTRRDQADQVGRVMYRTLGRYFGGSVTVAMFMGLFVLALGLILQIPLVPLAAVWAMLTDLIPQVGGFLGGSVFVMLALTQGVPTALIAGAGFVLYMNIENHVIQPAIVGRSVDLTPATTMVAAFVGAAVAGVPGALVATPLVGATKALYLEARGRTSPTATAGGDESDSGGWRERLRRLVRRARPSSG